MRNQLQGESLPITNKNNRRPGPALKDQPAPSRKQQLNRQAQRLHRERSRAYLQRVEAEVQQLRNACLILSGERDHYRDMYLRAVGHEKNPACVDEAHSAHSHSSTCSQYMHSSAPTSSFTQESVPLSIPPLIVPGDSSDTASTEGGSNYTVDKTNTSSQFELLGVDFVLEMERKCLTHIQPVTDLGTNPRRPDRPDGHALLISFQRIQDDLENVDFHIPAVSCSSNIDCDANPFGLDQVEPSETLRTLLRLSSKLPLNADELTPVAAWSALAKHIDKIQDISKLKAFLVAQTECHGFGAVIGKTVIDDILNGKMSTFIS